MENVNMVQRNKFYNMIVQEHVLIIFMIIQIQNMPMDGKFLMLKMKLTQDLEWFKEVFLKKKTIASNFLILTANNLMIIQSKNGLMQSISFLKKLKMLNKIVNLFNDLIFVNKLNKVYHLFYSK